MNEQFTPKTPSNIDEYLCHNRHFKFELHLGRNTVISITPYKADFLVTWIDDNFEIKKQDRYPYWDDAFEAFNDMCNESLDFINNEYMKLEQH